MSAELGFEETAGEAVHRPARLSTRTCELSSTRSDQAR